MSEVESVPRFTLSPILTDIVAWIAATDIAALARFDFAPHKVPWASVSVLALFLAGGQLLVGGLVLMYGGRYVPGSFDEMRGVAVSATALCFLATAIVAPLHPDGLPRSLPFLAWPLALVAMGAVRFVKRIIAQNRSAPGDDAERILILGAGWLGSALALRMLRDPRSPYRPVAFLDDDPGKRNLRVHGLRVRGRLGDVADLAEEFGVRSVVVAVNDADSALLREIADAAGEAGLTCLVLPPLRETLRGTQVQLSAIRKIDVEDVIGRRPVRTDLRSITEYITGRRVLVTGAGGSIGSELCRQLHRYGPAELVLLDRDESALHAVELSLYGRALLDSPETVLCDIRDAEAVDRIFLEHQPEVVFHAAALKHLTLLERYPGEALRTNVYGTLNVLRAADANGVKQFVNISTDKAANPTSALGHSKRLAERLTAAFAHWGNGGRFLSVRFGNVLGSRGSVLHAFAAQIEAGGPLTVTDPEVSRFFMTVPEACELVIQAAAIGRGGEALVLDMSEPVKIVDVAERMIAMSGKDLEIVFTGLREGEKLHEELFGDGERGERPFHPLISHVNVPGLDPAAIASHPWVTGVLANSRRIVRAAP